ncbi:alpha/beta hydrolase [Oceanimonas sp. CHS3-5]|uniref:alpha/beta fold hydrolase n=1 Tax=Oceanimonas sp. CHS3-5 TaxID=3068186 RepID=UPI00273EA71C|nr:alpha/beta hydrolase [Oceanimonas sp. CHS3-5]MDP5292361.1 alpha/beta hydrolase [Oceanimonas sp. CHS3-5]
MTQVPAQTRLAQPLTKPGTPPPGWILLRGLARECRYWGDFPDRLATRLGAPVQCLELAGNGVKHEQHSARFIAGMLEQVRMEANLTAPVNLLGLSMGGMIAAQWAARYPREVAGLVLVNSSCGLSPFWQRMRPVALPRLLLALLLPRKQREAQVYRLTCARRDDRRATLQRWVGYANEYPVLHRNFVRQLAAAARFRVPAQALGITPLILCSRHDRLVDARCSHALADYWHTQVREHAWAGHDLPHDDPDWLLNELAGYVNE